MKVVQQLVVVAFCFIVFNEAFAGGETYDLIIKASVEPETSGEAVYIDKLINGAGQEGSAGLAGGNATDASDSVTEKDSFSSESRPYIYMKAWSED